MTKVQFVDEVAIFVSQTFIVGEIDELVGLQRPGDVAGGIPGLQVKDLTGGRLADSRDEND